MHEIKMTNNLVATTKFICTLTHPVKTKTVSWISKHKTVQQEAICGVVEVSPVCHQALEEPTLANEFYSILCLDRDRLKTKNRQKELENFIEACPERVRQEIMESIAGMHLENIQGKTDYLFVNLLDQRANLVKTIERSLEDIIADFDEIKKHLENLPKLKKPSLFAAATEEVKQPKPRHKERKSGNKEGGTRRFHSTHTEKPT